MNSPKAVGPGYVAIENKVYTHENQFLDMNIFRLTWAYILHRKLNNTLSVFLVAFGSLLITTLFLLTRQFQVALEKNINDIDMVIGAKGSPMQIILSAIFHIDFPTGNIDTADANYFANHPLVKEAVAISLGDSYEKYRIVGTKDNFYGFYNLTVEKGAFAGKPLDVSVGSNVAKNIGLQIADQFSGFHGFSEGEEHEVTYTVVGILSPTGSAVDNLILTPLESYWITHTSESDKKEITNLLIRYKNPMAALRLPALINATGNLQAAVPSFEAARLFSMIGIGQKFINGLAFLLIGFSALSIFISMYSSLNEKKYDLAVMHSLGATKLKLFTFSLLEGILISLLGGLLGLFLAHVALELLSSYASVSENLLINGRHFYREELLIIALCLISGMVGSFVPAFISYKTNIAKILSEEG